MPKLKKDVAVQVCEKLSKAYSTLTFNDIIEWADKNERLDNLMEYIDTLPQRKIIADANAIAWLYSFEHREESKDKDRIFETLKERFRKLTPHECAVIQRETEENTPVWFRGRCAETIRRSFLFENLYSDQFTKSGYAEREFLKAFFPKLTNECLNTAQPQLAAEYGSCGNIKIHPLKSTDDITAKYRRYGMVECDTKQGHIICPCLFVCKKKDDNETDKSFYLPEFGAMALIAKGKIGGGFICEINKDSCVASIETVTKEQIELYKEKVAKTVKQFWQENLLANQPFTIVRVDDKKQKMDDDATREYMAISDEYSKLHMAGKMIEERKEILKTRLNDYMRNYAEENCVALENVQTPQTVLGMVRSKVVNGEEAQRILDTMPEAANLVISKLEPDKDMMIKYMEEHNINESCWKKAKIDPDAMMKFCADNNLISPVGISVSFRVNATSKKAKEMLSDAAAQIQPALEILGMNNGETVNENEQEYDAPTMF